MREQYENLERPLILYMLMRGDQVTGWSSDYKFANSCCGRNERVVQVVELPSSLY
jgi:hypothetical protein